MSGARKVQCGACHRPVPFWLGGPIALEACPACAAYFPEKLEGAPIDRSPAETVAAPVGVEPWYTPGDAFLKRWSLVDALHYGATYALLRAVSRQRSAPALFSPALVLMLRAESPEAMVAIASARERLAPLTDPAVLKVVESDADGSSPYLAYDLPEGKLLAQVPAAELAGRPELAGTLFAKVVEALVRLQSAGVAASELSPALVAVRPRGDPVLLGAGLGHRLAGMLPLTGPSAPAAETWIAPELLAGEAPRPATDVYGAVLLYTAMRTGSPATLSELIAHEKNTGPLLALDPFARALVRAGLEPDPARRIASPAELAAVLAAGKLPAEVAARLGPLAPYGGARRAAQQAGPDATAADRNAWQDLDAMRGRVDQGVKDQEVVLRRLERNQRVMTGFQKLLGTGAIAMVGMLALAVWPIMKGRMQPRYPMCDVELLQVMPGGSAIYKAAVDGSEMILVPDGETTVGISLDEAAIIRKTYEPGGVTIVERETPEQTSNVRRFLIDRHEVTNQRYKRFLDHIAKTGDHSRCHPNEPRGMAHVPRVPARWAVAYTWNGTDFPPNMGDRPVVLVTWFDGYAYAAWAGLRLPSELEWERAARGNDRRHFPWGNTWEINRANGADRVSQRALGTWSEWKAWVAEWKKQDESERNHGTLTPVGAYPGGASPFGCLDMAGNVWEWTREDYKPGYRAGEAWSIRDRVKVGTPKIVRGGSWCNFRSDLRVSRRGGFAAGNAESYIGFRCARDAPAAAN